MTTFNEDAVTGGRVWNPYRVEDSSDPPVKAFVKKHVYTILRIISVIALTLIICVFFNLYQVQVNKVVETVQISGNKLTINPMNKSYVRILLLALPFVAILTTILLITENYLDGVIFSVALVATGLLALIHCMFFMGESGPLNDWIEKTMSSEVDDFDRIGDDGDMLYSLKNGDKALIIQSESDGKTVYTITPVKVNK
jgi:hypothetical protein